jgi:predicted dehydrogenase
MSVDRLRIVVAGMGYWGPSALAEDLDELLADLTLDGVALATPVPSHAEPAMRVLKAGKQRRFTLVGSRQMATFDDMAREGKLTIYDKGFEEAACGYGEYITRSGAIYSRQIPNAEPLRVECEHFVHCARTGETPRSDGAGGLRVVRVLEQLQRSLEGSSVVAAGAQAGA